MKRFLKTNVLRRFTLFLGLSLLLCATIRAQQNEQRIIRTIEELTEALATPSLRSDEPVTYTIVDEGIAVTKEIPVGAGKFILKGGPLYRDENYEGVMMRVNEGSQITIQNTIDGRSILCNDPMVLIAEGSMTLGDQGVITNSQNILYVGDKFILDGGTLSNVESGYVIRTGLKARVELLKGKIEQCNGSGLLVVFNNNVDVYLDPANVSFVDSNVHMLLHAPFTLLSSLNYTLSIETGLEEGATIINGSDDKPYQLTESDLEHIEIENFNDPRLIGKLQGNQIALERRGIDIPNIITTEEELQAAIDAVTGTQGNPTVIKIKDDGIHLAHQIIVGSNKHVLLTGGTITTDYHEMFEIQEYGSLTLKQITIDGGCTAEQEKTCWGFRVAGGSLIMEDGAVIKGFGLAGDIGIVNLYGGRFYLNGGSISDNYFLQDQSGCSLIYVGLENGKVRDSYFQMNGGEIAHNHGTGKLMLLDEIGDQAILEFKGGEVKDNENLWVEYDGGIIVFYEAMTTFQAPINVNFKQCYIRLAGSLGFDLNLTGEHFAEGEVIISPYNSDPLTQADVEHIIVDSEELMPKLQNNQIILAKKVVIPDIITTQEELQAAIDAATGTKADPSEIKIAEAGITLTKTIEVKDGHYVTLTGGTIKNGFENTGQMFTIAAKSGLTLRQIVIDGGCTDQEKTCWGFRVNGNLEMKEGATLMGFGLTSDISVVFLDNGGTFTMSSGLICKNFFLEKDRSMCSIVAVGSGSFIMNGGEIINNQGDDKLISLIGWGMSYSSVQLNGGIIAQNGTNYIYSSGSAPLIVGKTSVQQDILLGSAPQITNALDGELHFRFMDNMKVEDGFVVLKSYQSPTTPDCYQITQADVAKIKLPEGYTAVLQGNQVVVKVGDPEPVFDLQALIDAAEVGTLENPSVITLTEDVVLSKAIAVKGKHIKLAGGKTITAPVANNQYLRMFNVTEKGSLTLDNVVLDGTAEGYVSFAAVDENACLTLKNGTVLRNAKVKNEWYALKIDGSLVMDQCTFTQNVSYGLYALVMLNNQSQWLCKESIISHNNAYGTDGTGVSHLFSTSGQSSIQSCQIINNTGYVMHACNNMSLTNVTWQDNMCDMLLVPSSTSNENRTYVAEGGEPTSIGIVGENGENHLMFSGKVGKKIAIVYAGMEGCVVAEGYNDYQLTEEDLAQFTLENSSGYTLQLKDNKIMLKLQGPAIDTQAKLQAAINASKGTAENPEVITLTGEISVSSTITIDGKYVRLTGWGLKKAKSGYLNMFYVKSGFLGFTNIILDGAQDQFSGYCSFIQAYNYSESRVDIGEGAKLTNALGGNGRENYIVCASAALTTLNGGEISGNFVDGSVVFVDWSRNFVMNSGSITANKNVGSRYLMNIISVAGYATINGGTIANNIGNHLAVYHYGRNVTVSGNANIDGEMMIYPDHDITIASPLQRTLTFSFLFGLSYHPTGTIVAKPAEGYTLTEEDLSHFRHYRPNVYGLRLENGNIVVVNLAAENKTFQVKVADVAHGSLTVDKTTAKENDEITVTVTPDEGYKLYSLVYNDSTKLKQAPTGTYIYTFQMPPKDVTISAQFIKKNATVNEPKTEDPTTEDPDAIRPGKTIGNLDDLIEALNQGNENGSTEITPKTKTPTIGDSDPINGEIDQAEDDGDEVIGSIEELINVLNTNSDGTTKEETLTILPAKVTMRLYLPNRLFTSTTLRATDSPYYILNQYSEEGELKVATIETVYDEESHSVTFETDRLGIFVVMRGTLNEPVVPPVDPIIPVDPVIPDKPNDVANAEVNNGQPIVYVAGSRIVIEGLGVGQSYAIYDLSGQILKAGEADGSTIRFQPNASSNYVVRYGHSVQIIHFKK